MTSMLHLSNQPGELDFVRKLSRRAFMFGTLQQLRSYKTAATALSDSLNVVFSISFAHFSSYAIILTKLYFCLFSSLPHSPHHPHNLHQPIRNLIDSLSFNLLHLHPIISRTFLKYFFFPAFLFAFHPPRSLLSSLTHSFSRKRKQQPNTEMKKKKSTRSTHSNQSLFLKQVRAREFA